MVDNFFSFSFLFFSSSSSSLSLSLSSFYFLLSSTTTSTSYSFFSSLLCSYSTSFHPPHFSVLFLFHPISLCLFLFLLYSILIYPILLHPILFYLLRSRFRFLSRLRSRRFSSRGEGEVEIKFEL